MSSGNWTIAYSETNLGGVAVHGVLTVYDGNGNVVKSFEGLATSSNGSAESIGSEITGDNIKGYYYNGLSANAKSSPITVYSGTESEVESRISAMETATDEINSENISYQIPGPTSIFSDVFGGNGTNTNSNSYISTMFAVLGLPVPSSPYTTLLGQEGGDAILLTQDQINNITAPYGINYNSIPENLPDVITPQISPGTGSNKTYLENYDQTSGVITETELDGNDGDDIDITEINNIYNVLESVRLG